MRNQDLKNRFLKEGDLAVSTQRTFMHILTKGARTEEDFNKDIYEFTPYECDQLLFSFSASSEGMVFVLISCFKQYFDFCKLNNLDNIDELNYFATITGLETVRKYVNPTVIENKYITYEQLLEIEGLCINEQDAVIPELLFIGIKGESAEDLLGLDISQIKKIEFKTEDGKWNTEYKIMMKDREIPISERTYDLIIDAYEQIEYLKGNGEYEGKSKKLNLESTSTRILKVASRGVDSELSYGTLQSRMIRIKEYFGNPYLTMTNIWVSGMIHLAKQIKEEKGELKKEDWVFVNKRFGYPEQYWSQTKLRLKHLI